MFDAAACKCFVYGRAQLRSCPEEAARAPAAGEPAATSTLQPRPAEETHARA